MNDIESSHTPEQVNNDEHASPCLEFGCSWCCNPVKIPYRNKTNFDMPSQVDKNGNEIWADKNEILAPDNHIETVRVKTFDCKNFNKETGLCNDYENRPDICRDTSCIDVNSDLSIIEQHKKLIKETFIKLK